MSSTALPQFAPGQRKQKSWNSAACLAMPCGAFAKNKLAMAGFFLVALLVLIAIFGDLIAPYPYDEADVSQVLKPPSAEHLMGTDQVGRDEFSRLVYGARISLTVGWVFSLLPCGSACRWGWRRVCWVAKWIG